MIWIIEDDEYIFKTMCDEIEEAEIKTKIIRYESVPEALDNPRGKPDLILVDQTAIGGFGGSMGMGCTDLFYSNLGYLVKNHLYSVFGIYSAVPSYAEDLVDDIKERFGDEVIIELIAYDEDSKSITHNALTAVEFIKKHTEVCKGEACH